MNPTSWNRQQLLTVAALVAVAVWAGDKLIYSPLTKRWSERSTRIVELQRLVNQGTQLLERETWIRSRWEAMRTNTLPTKTSAAESQVWNACERWSKDTGISITSIKPLWRRDAEQFMTLECRVDGFGSLATVTRFLYEVEKDPMAIKVEAVELSARDADGSQLTLGLQISGLLLNPAEP